MTTYYKLTPKSLKAKNRVREAGNPARWVLIEKRYSVAFSDRPGPWLYLRPDVPGQDTFHARWVSTVDDPHFVVEPL